MQRRLELEPQRPAPLGAAGVVADGPAVAVISILSCGNASGRWSG